MHAPLADTQAHLPAHAPPAHAAAGQARVTTAIPLTHHEILAIVEPFTRRGRRVDLEASNRLERRLLFKAIEHPEAGSEQPALRETLQLESLDDDSCRLTRLLALPGGLQARLQTEGADAAELLARLESIALQCQFRAGPGYLIAFSQRLEPAAGPSSATAGAAGMILTGAEARVAGLSLTMRVPQIRGYEAHIEVAAPAGDTIRLPEDLLAVLGWPWARLSRVTSGWKSVLRLRSKEPERSPDAGAKLEQTVQHLARTLAEPPRCFHETHRRARWKVSLRRGFPLLFCIALIIGAASVPALHLDPDSWLRMVIFNSPPLLLLFFGMGEMPVIEIPPLPRPLATASWRDADAAAAAAVSDLFSTSSQPPFNSPG
jgi:hypothetical protein